MSEQYEISETMMIENNPSGARPNRNWLKNPQLAEPAFYAGTIGILCLYMWLMISHWIG